VADALLVHLPFGLNSGAANGSPATFNNFTCDQSADAAEFIFQAPPDGSITITQLGIRLATITGTTPTYRISLQGVDAATGNPDGTIKGGGSPASKTFSPSSLGWSNNTWHWLTLDNSYATSNGEYLAVVIDYSTGTVDVSNNASFTLTNSAIPLGFPYVIANNNGSRSKQSLQPIFGYKTASAAYGYPLDSAAATAVANNTGTADEYGIKFSLPAAWGNTYKIKGVRFHGAFNQTAGGTTDFILYSGSDTTAANSTGAVGETTVQQQVSYDHDYRANLHGVHDIYFDEATLATLYHGATYRLMVRPTTTTNVTIHRFQMAAASDWDAWCGRQNVTQSTRLDAAGNFTDDTTWRPAISPILADITEPAGGGGLLTHSGMVGGMRG
jgi:hypothetical protein